jgi:hypothetical protein
VQRYDPNLAPDAASWLGLDEEERLDLIRGYHRLNRIKLPSLDAHAIAHLIVENQLAEELPPALNALARLLAGGLERHDAVHAIGAVLMDHLWDLSNKPPPEGDPNKPYFAALDELTVKSWQKRASS